MSKIIVPEAPPIVLGVGVRGRFKFIRRRSDESIVEETPFGKNHWTNIGLDYLCGRSDFGSGYGLNGCHVGSGNTPPEDDDSGLESFVAGVSGVFGETGSIDRDARYVRIVVTFRFPVGAAAGNLSEVGISIGGGAGQGGPSSATPDRPLATRALITDEVGNPVTISPQSDEILDVVWEYTKYAPLNDLTGTFEQEIDGVIQTFDYIVRPAATESTPSDSWTRIRNRQLGVNRGSGSDMRSVGSGGSSGVLGDPFGILNPSGSNASSYTSLGPYVDGTYYADSRLSFNLTAGNGNLRSFKFNNIICGWQMQIDPVVQKTPQKQYYIDIRNTIGRYVP